MKEQCIIIRNKELRSNAAKAVMEITGEPLCEVVIRPHTRIRTTNQNARYWASLNEELRQLSFEINGISEHTGYSDLETRRLIAKELQPEQAALLFARSAEAAHDILKTIHGIDTSTRLGTKKFMEFEERMIQTVAEVVGAARSLYRSAA